MLTSFATADHERLSRIAALAVCAAAVAIGIWLLVQLVWLIVPHADAGSDGVASAVPAPAAATTQSVGKWHLFGNPQSVNLAQLARNAPATTLKLTLVGTLVLSDPKLGIAMIADEQGGERGYNIGDDVAGGARLAEVYTDHVVLSHEGAAETLQLPRPEAHAPPLPEANQHNLAAAQGKASSVPPNYVPPIAAHGALDWSKAQKQLRADPAELAKQVHVDPVFDGTKMVGARLSASGQIGTMMSQAGLRPTDLITAVNGTALSGLSNPQQLMDNLQNASSLQVTVLRDGKQATLTVNLR